MRAWLMDSYEGVEKLRLVETDEPTPGRGEALLKVLWAALNPADAFLAQAQYPAKPPLPHILGRDALGEVLAVGEGVTGCVQATSSASCAAKWASPSAARWPNGWWAPADALATVPDGWTPEEMAGAPLVFLTAWQALTQWSTPEAPPPAGETLLVTGASGGRGRGFGAAGQVEGLTVVALSRSASKREKLRHSGRRFRFRSGQSGPAQVCPRRAAPAQGRPGGGHVAGPLFNQIIPVLGYGGRISAVGRSGGVVPEFNTATLFFRRVRIGGVATGDYSHATAQTLWKEIVARLAAAGRRPVIDRVFPFEEVPAAFARLAEGPMGKVLVRVTK
jgi:NADPH2:quinone reductase